LDAAPGIAVTEQPISLDKAWELARSLEVCAVVHIPAQVTKDVGRGRAGTIFAYYDASHPTAGQAALRDIQGSVQALGGRVLAGEIGRARGVQSLRPPPIASQASILFNSVRSYESYLLGLLFPALLHFAMCLSVAAALGRELRDGTAGNWLATCGNRVLPAVAGKVAPYLAAFLLLGMGSLIWLTRLRGDGVRGSVVMLLLGQALMYSAYASIALLLVGATKIMSTALSVVSLYAGTSLAFSGTTFSVKGATLFARFWNLALPFTAYVKLQAQQLYAGAPWTMSLVHALTLLGFIVVPGLVGLRLYGRAARDPAAWGLR
jgi:ABC-2 type transport system permease protein